MNLLTYMFAKSLSFILHNDFVQFSLKTFLCSLRLTKFFIFLPSGLVIIMSDLNEDQLKFHRYFGKNKMKCNFYKLLLCW